MRAGQLRHVIYLHEATPIADGDGGFADTWVPLSPGRIKASISPATPADISRKVGNAVIEKVSHLVAIWYHPGVTTKTRITFDGRSLFVRGIQNEDEMNIALQLACEEIVQ